MITHEEFIQDFTKIKTKIGTFAKSKTTDIVIYHKRYEYGGAEWREVLGAYVKIKNREIWINANDIIAIYKDDKTSSKG